MSWKRVHGHDRVIAAFERAVARGRLAHGYLFTGPSGVGKRLFAFELGKTLLCEGRKADQFDACDVCAACTQIEAGTHPDFLMVGRPEDKHEWPIELMREVLSSFALSPARGKGKIAILDDADDFNEESANCFLKTLEEPPPRSLLLLMGTDPDRQLSTIRSRCQQIPFAPLPENLIIDLLREQGVEAGVDIQRLARLSGGSLGRAKSLADPVLWQFRQTFLGALTATPINTLVLSKSLMEFVEEAGKESAAQRQRATLVMHLVIDFLHDVLRYQMGGNPRLNEPQDLAGIKVVAQRVEGERLLGTLERCLQGEHHIDRRVQLVLALEAVVDSLGAALKAG